MEKEKWKENAIVEKLLLVLRICIVALGIAASAILVAGLVLRLFGANWGGYADIITFAAFWLYMLGAAYASFDNGYEKNPACDNLIKSVAVMDTVKLIRWIVITVLGVIMCWWGIKLCIYSAEQGMTTIIYGLPMIIGYVSMIVGTIIGSVFHLLYLADYVKFYVRTYIRKEAEI